MDKRKICLYVLAFILVMSLPVTVMAETSLRRGNIKSKGNLNFENGKVYFASSDLTYLADEIDNLESTYKTTVVSALNGIGTFFRKDGTIVYDTAQNEVSSEEEKRNLSFGAIKEGIEQSQSVNHLTGVQVRDKDGNLMYYESEEAANQKDVESLTKDNTGFPAFYKSAAADNLTVGTVAWVNGNLVKGTGDNKEIYYSQGWNDGRESVIGNLRISYTIIHRHEGTETSGTGCFTNLVATIPVYGNHQDAAHDADDKVYCKHCGVHMGNPVQASDGHWYTEWNEKKNEKCSDNITKYNNKYEVACGKAQEEMWETYDVSSLGMGNTIHSAQVIY